MILTVLSSESRSQGEKILLTLSTSSPIKPFGSTTAHTCPASDAFLQRSAMYACLVSPPTPARMSSRSLELGVSDADVREGMATSTGWMSPSAIFKRRCRNSQEGEWIGRKRTGRRVCMSPLRSQKVGEYLKFSKEHNPMMPFIRFPSSPSTLKEISGKVVSSPRKLRRKTGSFSSFTVSLASSPHIGTRIRIDVTSRDHLHEARNQIIAGRANGRNRTQLTYSTESNCPSLTCRISLCRT
mmetsp:Transcript_33839/g.76032  ORF Transcript_33839/g.76032 Transcript_33839/m.76032 type:complete len:241 (-) Transcript_33839:154-876(-)